VKRVFFLKERSYKIIKRERGDERGDEREERKRERIKKLKKVIPGSNPDPLLVWVHFTGIRKIRVRPWVVLGGLGQTRTRTQS
jgi:hypothetical protein